MTSPGLLIATAPLLVLLRAFPARGEGDRAVARVGGEAVTEREVASLLAREPGTSRAEALRALEERLLVLQWAKAKGVPPAGEADVDSAVERVRQGNRLSPEEFSQALARQGISLAAYRAEIRDSIVLSRATSAALADRVSVSEEEIAERYRQSHPPRPTFTLRHIFFALPADLPPEARAGKSRLADEAARQIRAGEITFEQGVERYSEDEGTKGSGGNLGTFSPGELFPEMENAAAQLSPGGVAGPVEGPEGLHIVLLAGRGSVEPPPLAEVREELAELLRGEKAEAARKAWIKELSRDYLIEEFPDPSAPPAR